MEEPVVIFKNVWKSYPSYSQITGGIKSFLFNLPKSIRELRARRTALEDINFEIFKGENFGFIGRNGAGKSTTLGLIAGVLVPEQGHIQINGRVSPLLELGAGFHPELSGRANILLNGVLLGLKKEEVLAHEQEIIDFAELGDFIDQPVRTYSSGMYAKLGFAVVATLKPEILLLDEILAVGDMNFQQKCKGVFEKFRKDKNITMILVSHSLESIESVCDRAAWIEGKKVKMIGPAKEVAEAYTNANKIQVPCEADFVVNLPKISVRPNCLKLDCFDGPALFTPEINSLNTGALLRISLFDKELKGPKYQWLIKPQELCLSFEGNTPVLQKTKSKENILLNMSVTPHAQETFLDTAKPQIMQMQIELDGAAREPSIWLPVSPSVSAKTAWNDSYKKFWDEQDKINPVYTEPPQAGPSLKFQPNEENISIVEEQVKGKHIRLISHKIIINDTESSMLIKVAAKLKKLGANVSLYAHQSSPELTGIVLPHSEVCEDNNHKDVVLLHSNLAENTLEMIGELVSEKRNIDNC